MILRPFRILTFVEKKVIIPPFLKKTQLFVIHRLPQVTTGYQGLPWVTTGYQGLHGYMIFWIFFLSLSTAHFIKSSDGDLQCEWNSDIFIFTCRWLPVILVIGLWPPKTYFSIFESTRMAIYRNIAVANCNFTEHSTHETLLYFIGYLGKQKSSSNQLI